MYSYVLKNWVNDTKIKTQGLKTKTSDSKTETLKLSLRTKVTLSLTPCKMQFEHLIKCCQYTGTYLLVKFNSAYYCYTCLANSSQASLGKPLSEFQTILGFLQQKVMNVVVVLLGTLETCKSFAPRSSQTRITIPSISTQLYRLDVLPVARATVSRHWRQHVLLLFYNVRFWYIYRDISQDMGPSREQYSMVRDQD